MRIKAFYGTSENAVKTQAWVALSVYVLVAIVKKQLGLDMSLYKILQILSITIFEKTPILEGFFNFADESEPHNTWKQLNSTRTFHFERSGAAVLLLWLPPRCGLENVNGICAKKTARPCDQKIGRERKCLPIECQHRRHGVLHFSAKSSVKMAVEE